MNKIDPNWEVSAQEVAGIRERGDPFVLLDVRKPEEFAFCKIEGAILIPLGELAQRLDDLRDLADDRPIVAHCHHGVRSLSAVAMLREVGFANVKSMAGGIDAWSVEVDPGVARY
jgi:rhodanese-related sulfurtransferase